MAFSRHFILSNHFVDSNGIERSPFGDFQHSGSFDANNDGSGMEESYVSLIKNLASGDRDAFEILYRENINRLRFFCMRFTPTKEDAEDVCADVFLKIWERRQTFVNVEDIRNYMFKMVRNKCINILRSEKVRSRHLDNLLSELENGEIPEKFMDIKSLYKEVLKAAESLPKQCRLIFNMAYYEGLKNQEIADHLKIEISTVKNQKHRAISFLRKNAFPGVLIPILISLLFLFDCVKKISY